jgi:hypothetical protein
LDEPPLDDPPPPLDEPLFEEFVPPSVSPLDAPPFPVLLGVVPASPVPAPPLLDELHEIEDKVMEAMTTATNDFDMNQA